MVSRPLKVASYNIHKGIGLDRRRNPERVLEVLREIDADVIALQEADRRFGTRRLGPEYDERRADRLAPGASIGHRRAVGFDPSEVVLGSHAQGRKQRRDSSAECRLDEVAGSREDGRLVHAAAGRRRLRWS